MKSQGGARHTKDLVEQVQKLVGLLTYDRVFLRMRVSVALLTGRIKIELYRSTDI